MCGICGIYHFDSGKAVDPEVLTQMTALQEHRGPDDNSIFLDGSVGLGHNRLSIIDLVSGSQPICNEDRSVWVVFNGEIFNYLELKSELIQKGHRFTTNSDTEVLVHLYEEYQSNFINLLNGQFAFAIWDRKEKQLLLARDRVGIRPLHYYQDGKKFLFSSEIKSLLAHPDVTPQLDLQSLGQIFTLWTTVQNRTSFQNIKELPPGTLLTITNGNVSNRIYWQADFTIDPSETPSEEEAAEQLKSLLIDATRLRLQADVPVGAYLSGGLDSSVITSLIKNFTDTRLQTFSIGFTEQRYDESGYQNEMAQFLNTNHNTITCSNYDIGEIFPLVIQHTERPILRTAPAPLLLLSRLVKQHSYKVVLTGEGADEVLGGYGIFKEDKIRRFWAQFPDSILRPLLLKKLYPYLPLAKDKAFAFSIQFFKKELLNTNLPYYSHLLRFSNTSRLSFFFSDQVKHELKKHDPIGTLLESLPADFHTWPDLGRAQCLEMNTLLSRYLLSCQGDRMSMANSIEGRYPFLDHRVIEFCGKLPPSYKLRVLNEKFILKKAMNGLIPNTIRRREKQAYRAPDIKCFVHDKTPEYVKELLSERKIKEYGLFDVNAVRTLIRKCDRNQNLGERDNMAFVGVLSTQLLYEHFISTSRQIYQKKPTIKIVTPERNELRQ